MLRVLKQNAVANVMVFMTNATDHINGMPGLTLAITVSKDGAAFGAITPTVNDRGSGWYNVTFTASHTDTLGDLVLHITASGADPTDCLYHVVAYDTNSSTNLGLTNLDTNIGSRSTLAQADIISDTIPFLGANINAAIGSRAAPGDILVNPANKVDGSKIDAAISSRSTLTQANILSDATPFAGAAVANLDAAVSSRAPSATAVSNADYTAGRAAKIDNLDATVSSRSTLTQAQIISDSTPFLGARIDAAIASRAAPGDILVNPANKVDGSKIDAAVSSRSTLTQAQIVSDSTPFLGANVDASISSRAPAATAVSSADYTAGRAVKIDNLDATVSSRSTLAQNQIISDATPFPGARIDAAITSRAAPADILTNPANKIDGSKVDATISSRSTLTQAQIVSDATPFSGASIDAAITSRAPAATAVSNVDYNAARALKIDNLDGTVASRAPAATAVSNADYTAGRALKMDNLDATVSSRSTLTQGQILSDVTPFAGAAIDVAISSRPTLVQIEGSATLAKEATSTLIKAKVDTLPASPASEDTATFIRRALTNKMTWDDVNKRWDIYDDAGAVILYHMQPSDKTSALITMAINVIAQRTRVE